MRIPKLLLLCFLVPLSFANAQTASSFNSLLSKVKQYDKDFPREKVHLHFDKPYYALGDTVWFEAYVVNGANNIPSDKSRILHVELIDSKDSICKALQLPVNIGFAAGDITLTDSLLREGNYHIRAYTNWMRNFGEDYFFNKPINVVNPFPQSANPAISKSNQAGNLRSGTGVIRIGYDVQFFPEGGELVNGLRLTVAFKAVSASGRGVAISGKLLDAQNNPVLDFKTAHAGMGSFMFTPEKGKNYIAAVQLPDGTTKNIALPKALESGYIITADNSNPDSLTVTLLASPELINKEEMVLMPLSNGEPLFFYKTNFPDKRVNITAPRSKLPGGMLQFTLFNSKNEPVAERLVFNSYQKANLGLTDLKPLYQKRGKTEIELQATDGAGNAVIGSFSMAVINADDVAGNEQTETTIFSNLLLTSDLKGHIETPNYYFTDPSATKNKELDNLLLTQGYRRFIWKDLADANNPPITYPAENAITVGGTVTRNNGSAVAGVQVLLFPKQNAGRLLDTVTNAQGHYLFKLPDGVIDTRYVIQAKEKGLQIFNIKPDSYQAAAITPLPVLYADTTTAVDNYIKATAQSLTASGKNINFNKVRYLKEVEVKDYRPKNKLDINSHSFNLNGPGHADYVLTGKDVEKCADLSCLVSLLPLIANHFSNMGTHIGDVLLIVDGVDVNTSPPKKSLLDWLTNVVSPNDVESIEFMKSGGGYASTYGIRGAGGVLLVTTRKGPNRETDTTTAKNRKYISLPVYMARQFYSPRYDDPATSNKGVDLRTTVYWNPEVITDKTGKAKVQFYNNDVPGNYRITIEGVTAKGILGRQVFNYKVE
jgi:hypothetical protein